MHYETKFNFYYKSMALIFILIISLKTVYSLRTFKSYD